MKSKDKDTPSNADERNLVTVDENFPDADAEDKFMLFWEKNGAQIVIVFVIASLGILGFQTANIMAAGKESKLQAEYAQAGDIEAKLAFAKEHSGHALAGVAYLEAANEEYAEGNYTEAKSYYIEAVSKLEEPFAGRAKLGEAMSELNIGNRANAITMLSAIVDNPDLADNIRGEAITLLATLQWEDGQTGPALATLGKIDSLIYAGTWSQKAMMIKSQIESE